LWHFWLDWIRKETMNEVCIWDEQEEVTGNNDEPRSKI
jgi:hypothetical protein